MPEKVDPRKLVALSFPPRPDPRADWLGNARAIAPYVTEGKRKLGPADRLRRRAGWRFSPACAAHFEAICKLFLRHTKGRWAGQPLVWHEWQRRDWINPIFGWYTPQGIRGIKRVYIECGKKSGKSTFAAAVAIYMGLFAGEAGAEVYCLASTKDQSEIVQRQVEQMIRGNPQLEARSLIRANNEIKYPHTNALIASKAGTGISGPNPYCLILDELHEWKGHEAFDTWTFGSMVREGWLHLSITNAGDDEQSVCYRQRDYCKRVMAGDIDDPTYYGKIYAATREEAEAEIESVGAGATRLPIAAKCNPGLGSIIQEENLITEIKQAIHVPSNMPNLLRFLYCVWRTAADDDWLARHWDPCGRDMAPDAMADIPVWLGLDMSSVTDLTALVTVGRDDHDRYWVRPIFWVPRLRAQELRKWTAVEQWEKDGWIRVIPGKHINHQVIVDTILELAQSHRIQALVYDPREATAIVQAVSGTDGPELDVVPFRQSHENYHEPTDQFEALVKSEELYHDRNPVLAWQVKHAWCKETTHGYKKPIKPDPTGAPHKGVDGVQAAIMALSQAITAEPEMEATIYELA